MKARPRPRPAAVVLLSGGMDSATCLAIAARRGPVHALSVEYGQRHLREVRSARALARHYQVASYTAVRLPVGPLLDSALTHGDRPLPTARARRSGGIPATYVPARNTLLLALALGFAESHRARTIYIGINAVDYSGYPDCRPEYLRAFRRLARLATREGVEGRPTQLRAPLLRLSKADIVRLGERLGVPWSLTWSCYAGGARPCGRCDACRLRRRGFAEAGIPDPVVARGLRPDRLTRAA
ncbi:MAG TPA: 7-cyano-7-deazaguanine synthase QueC [Thermoplasmata archaeon]|nr:7-cyano-7-deazaguanine synthase QueC [Thermoplasmata archaeon]